MALISEDTVGYLSNSKVFRDNIGDIESKKLGNWFSNWIWTSTKDF